MIEGDEGEARARCASPPGQRARLAEHSSTSHLVTALEADGAERVEEMGMTDGSVLAR